MRRRIETFTSTFRQVSLICFWKVRGPSIVSARSWIWLTLTNGLLIILNGDGKVALLKMMDWN